MRDRLTLTCDSCRLVVNFNFGGPGPALPNYMRAQHRKKNPKCVSPDLKLKLEEIDE